MPHLVPIKPNKLIKILENEGFVCIRVKGSHHFFINKISNKTTVIPLHSKDIKIGLLKKILNDLSWSNDDFISKL